MNWHPLSLETEFELLDDPDDPEETALPRRRVVPRDGELRHIRTEVS